MDYKTEQKKSSRLKKNPVDIQTEVAGEAKGDDDTNTEKIGEDDGEKDVEEKEDDNLVAENISKEINEDTGVDMLNEDVNNLSLESQESDKASASIDAYEKIVRVTR